MNQFAKGTHGFYSPPIKVWNDFYQKVQEELGDSFKLRGHIEDLFLDNPEGLCSHCDTDLVRISTGVTNGYFSSGIIYCPKFESEGHPREGWLEIWTNVNHTLSPRDLEVLSSEKRIRNNFSLSDPKIKECYTSLGILCHHMQVEAGTREILERPKPAYVHTE